MSIPFSARLLYSTTEDLLRWEQGLFGGKVLSPASLEKMTKPFLNDYAFGLAVHTVDGLKVIDHGGGIEGFNTHLTYYPEDKVTIVVLGNLNSAAPDEIAAKLGALAHGKQITLNSERKEIAVPRNILQQYTGAYELQPGFDLVVTLEGDQLMTQATGQAKLPLFAESETKFFLKAVDAQVEFARDRLILHQNGRDITAKRK